MIGWREGLERGGDIAQALEILGERAARRALIEVLPELRRPDRPERSVH
jgi:hypothetical protein